MDNLRKVLTAGTLFLAFLMPRIAFSQTVKIGYVDLKEVFSKFEKANEMEGKFKKEVEVEQKNVSELEANIKKMQEDYSKKKDIMKPEEREKKEAELKDKIQEFTKMWSDVNKKLDEKRKGLEDVLLKEIKEKIEEYGQKNGYTAILDSRVVIYGQNAVNITGEIIKVVNKGDVKSK